MRCLAEKNTAPGEISLSKRHNLIIGSNIPDPFFDGYKEEIKTAYDILDSIEDSQANSIALEFDKMFLRKIVRSHIHFIQDLEKKGSLANGHPAPRENRNTF